MRGAPVRLRCEYLDNPLGIDTDRPRLSWWLNDPRPAELQTAYQIQAATSAARLEAGAADLWDTGYVSSQQTLNVEYRGRPLRSEDRVWWRVRCYDSDGTPSPWSGTARFELGLLAPEDWQAGWIAAPLSGSPSTAAPVALLFRDLELPERPVAARLHLAVLGSAVIRINGHEVSGDEPVEPWVDLRRRVPGRVWDVAGQLRRGSNRLAVLLADGDYCGHLCGGPRQRYGLRPALRAQLSVELENGSRRLIVSDRQWRWTPSGVLRADRDRGEEVDGRQCTGGWDPAGAADPAGFPVTEETLAPETFVQRTPPARVVAEHEPVAAPRRRRDADGTTRLRFDFGRSVLGRLRLTLNVVAGATVSVRYGEWQPPEADAETGTDAPSWSPGVDRYTARGDGPEVFEPRFALHAFRWVEVCFDAEPNEVASVSALEVASSVPLTAGLTCDHRLLEGLFGSAQRTLQLGLAMGPVTGLAPRHRQAVSADCEGILGAAAACLDAAGMFQSWLGGLAAMQQSGGTLPPRLPDLGPEEDEPTEVESLLPSLWLVYRCYGDRRLLEQLYPAVQRYLAGIRERWPDLIRGGASGSARPLREQMLGTAWYCYALSVATRMAGVLGRLADLESYEALAERVGRAFRGRFLTRDGVLVEDDQLGYLLTLQLGLLEGAERPTAMSRLEAQLRRRGFHPQVDLRHGALLLEVLSLEGRVDLAYQTLLQTTAPGWLHPLTAGADLLWDEERRLAGRLAAAGVAGWLQRFLLGLDLDDDLTPELNAYRRMRVQPRPPVGSEFAAGAPVREASGFLDTVHGRYECGWRITDAGFELNVRVPGNCSARVILPDGSERLVVAGTHDFSVDRSALDAAGATVAAAARADDDVPLLRDVSSSGT